MAEVHVRDATEADLPAVAEIHAYESLNSNSTFETEERPSGRRHKLHGLYSDLLHRLAGSGFHTAQVRRTARGFTR